MNSVHVLIDYIFIPDKDKYLEIKNHLENSEDENRIFECRFNKDS